MDNSRRTTIIAQGIYLWARVMGQPSSVFTDEQRLNVVQWQGWAETWPSFVEMVKSEQFKLFDRVNAKTWPDEVKEPRYGDIRVNDKDYDDRIVIEQYRLWNSAEPYWAVPAWEEQGDGDLEGPFESVEEARAALASRNL